MRLPELTEGLGSKNTLQICLEVGVPEKSPVPMERIERAILLLRGQWKFTKRDLKELLNKIGRSENILQLAA